MRNLEPAPSNAGRLSQLYDSREPQLSEVCNPQTCRWRPYSNSSHFESGAAVAIVVLMSAFICALSLGAAIRCFLRGDGSSINQPPERHPPITSDLEQGQPKPSPQKTASSMTDPPTVYPAAIEIAGNDECAICLSEFQEGDLIQVLESCKHGFHIACIHQWLFSRSSCPICRASALSSSCNP